MITVAYLFQQKICSLYIVDCAIFPNKNGFIHKFDKNQFDLLILSTFEKETMESKIYRR